MEGFVPERLRDAMSVRDRTGKELAELVGITETTISRYLTGATKPQPHVFVRLTVELDLPGSYFIRPTVPLHGSALFYRSLAAATKRARAGAAVRNRWLREAWNYFHGYVDFATVGIPEFDLPADPEAISLETVEWIAQQVRVQWGLEKGPIANVVRLLEHHGGVVARVNLGSPKLDAFSQWGAPENRPFFVLNADKRSAARSRWDAAHELGHMVLHRHVDRARLQRPETFKVAELQAHRFAGAFLLPADSFGRSVYVPAISSLVAQKRIWRVSVAGMLRRMQQLRLISTDHATRVWQSYSRSGMRLREPLDDEMQPEQPEVMRRACEMLMSERVVSREQLLEVLPFDPAELQALLGLPLGFGKSAAPPVRLRLSPASDPPPPAAPPQDASVLPMPGIHRVP